MAKKDETNDTDALRAENDTLRSTQDQMVDMLAELQSRLDAIETGSKTSAPVVDSTEAKLDAEWRALKEEFADVPNIEVLDHRMAAGSSEAPALRLKAAPGGIPEPTIADDPHGETCYWKLRWFNFAIEGRAERFVSEGYLKVLKEEMADLESIPSLSAMDQYVRKGERGQEVLGKIPRKIFEFKKKRDALRSGRLMTSESALKDHVANRVAGLAGASGGNADRAGSTVHGQFRVTIKKGETERVTA